ncbi:MAG: DUF4190 domain-containing protein [Clostridiales bacterium]|nr:DUF4190 domain-containing protein [Clostridiales bacterium]
MGNASQNSNRHDDGADLDALRDEYQIVYQKAFQSRPYNAPNDAKPYNYKGATIAALVLSFGGILLPVLSIAGFILGIVCIIQGRKRGEGIVFAIAALVISVAVLILTVMATGSLIFLIIPFPVVAPILWYFR